jgi:hypothetical protein
VEKKWLSLQLSVECNLLLHKQRRHLAVVNGLFSADSQQSHKGLKYPENISRIRKQQMAII